MEVVTFGMHHSQYVAVANFSDHQRHDVYR